MPISTLQLHEAMLRWDDENNEKDAESVVTHPSFITEVRVSCGFWGSLQQQTSLLGSGVVSISDLFTETNLNPICDSGFPSSIIGLSKTVRTSQALYQPFVLRRLNFDPFVHE